MLLTLGSCVVVFVVAADVLCSPKLKTCSMLPETEVLHDPMLATSRVLNDIYVIVILENQGV